MIDIINIHKSYGSLEVLKGINAHIGKGEIVSIVGPSGAGKTTLLQIIGTLDKPDSGEIHIGEVQTGKLKKKELSVFRNNHIGFVFQFHQLLPEFTAIENVMIPALIRKEKSSVARKRAKEILDYLNLSDRDGTQTCSIIRRRKTKSGCCPCINKPTGCYFSRRTVRQSRHPK